jgi:excisionase family DNA binding protein
VVSPGAASTGRLRVLDGGADHLLTVRAAAERLAVSTATVYALCERGELPHVRVSNAIRIAPADLAAFLAGQRAGGR